MRRVTCLCVLLLLALACEKKAGAKPEHVYLSNASGDAAPKKGTGLKLTRVAAGLTRPLELVSPPGDARLFVVEQPGTIRIVKDGKLLSEPFLDVSNESSKMLPYTEQGLLGLAFHPDYAENGRFFVHYTSRKGGDTVLAEYKVSDDPDRADAGSENVLFGTKQPFVNHNGGKIAFGPDGMLYLGLGDGGSANDPLGSGQNPRTPLGSILRFDVSKPGKAMAPPDNPFVGKDDGLDVVFHYGLRNPWKFSFDSKTGDLYIGDVGQNTWEYVNFAPAGSKGVNFGWNTTEGFVCFHGEGCKKTGLTDPVLAYHHDVGCSINGGFVYRGKKLKNVDGAYFYSDYCSPFVRSFRLVDGKMTEHTDWSDAFQSANLKRLSAFGQDAAGEIYVIDYGRGNVWRIDSK